MSSYKFFTIGEIENIPNKYVINFELKHSQNNAYPKHIDNVIIFINNQLDYLERFELLTVANKPTIRYVNEVSHKYTHYNKLFIVICNNKISSQLIQNIFSDYQFDIIINENWDKTFQIIEKNIYYEPWYIRLINYILFMRT